ncbi:MAG: HEAT repeat domain-containing protein [Planctomycetia bacterium]|nr:HEAT repeat domain-containing protein [Planctomycetia bacterium]
MQRFGCLILLTCSLVSESRAADAPVGVTVDHSPKRSVAELADTLLTDKEPEVRRRAAYALGQQGPSAAAAVPALIKALDDRHLEVSWYAADALGRIGPAAAPAVEPLVKAMESPENDQELRRNAARALGRIGKPARAAMPALTRALTSNDALYRVAAAAALWRIDQQATALDALAGELKPAGGEGPFAAAGELANFGPAAAPAINQLVVALGSADEDLQRAAIDALGQIGPAAISSVVTALDRLEATQGTTSDAEATRRLLVAMIEALGRIADTERRTTLDPASRNAEEFVAAARPLLPQLVPALVAQLGASDDEVRTTAARAIARLGFAAVPALIGHLSGSNPRAMEGAQLALAATEPLLTPSILKSPAGELGKQRLQPRLIALLEKQDPAVRAAGFRLFAALLIGPEGRAAAPALRAGLADPNPEIRRQAAMALARLGGT